MTNRHVAQSFTTNVDGIAKIRIGWKPAIDFLAHLPPPENAAAHDGTADDQRTNRRPRTITSTVMAAGRGKPASDTARTVTMTTDTRRFHTAGPSACFRITSVLYVDDEIDLALLRVEFAGWRAEETAASSRRSFWHRRRRHWLALTRPCGAAAASTSSAVRTMTTRDYAERTSRSSRTRSM